MKNILRILSIFLLIVTGSGCTTIYKAAVDERDIRTIASDTEIKTKIVKRFIDDEVIKTFDISVGCYNGHVYLIGEYEKRSQKSRAIKIAKSVQGVKKVTTYMLPKKDDPNCGTSKNLKLMTKVKAKLIGDKEIWSTNIDVKSIQCIIVLYGFVGSQNEIDKSISHAKSVEGVRDVTSFLKSK